MSRLAIFGGTPLRRKPFPAWPVFDHAEEDALREVLCSGRWWRYASSDDSRSMEPAKSKVAEFQETFARFQGAEYGIACANGTAAL